MTYTPWYIIPLLIKQPTWGGEYIASHKNITEPALEGQKVGQSYELAGETIVALQAPTQPTFEIVEATDLTHPTRHGDTQVEAVTLQSVIDQDPAAVLGRKVLKKNGPRVTTLIKFTQAQNNSYQLHVPKGKTYKHWIPKPESWYYFEPGKVTLGLAPGCDVAAYKARCLAIYEYSQTISQAVKTDQLPLSEAKRQLKAFIDQDHPSRFVNTVFTQAGDILDLSQGGMHHSWETDPSLPHGNILYEVQQDSKDDVSTLRSFDQGSLKDDGSIRPLTIDDYFELLDTDPQHNDPATHKRLTPSQTDAGAEIQSLFLNDEYQLSLIRFSDSYQGKETQLQGAYHHLFVKTGSTTVIANNHRYPLKQGWSLFIPAQLDSYSLESTGPAEILKTTAA